MIDILILRNDVLLILESLLGTYTFPDRSTSPAIACLPDPEKGWNYPENGTKTSGLEVVIKRPYPDVEANIGGDRTFTNTWEIHLKQWDTNASLVDVINKLSAELPAQYFIERVSPMPASDKLLTVEQCKLFITDWALTSP
ncbi:hypothetical protein [Nostoc sp. JL23]|uniref:hypothetical protein n=1 Tax=Nostoc sp. JL23 TaxID=2815394 RepID=UPI001DB631FA|nr:hypothetical protein [Nostoc sp. JL23]MBN3875193.1 hypothetical protein [Nostoc sp. JL23]